MLYMVDISFQSETKYLNQSVNVQFSIILKTFHDNLKSNVTFISFPSGGFTYSRRPLWVHTKGRYVCVQCGHVVSNSNQMTQHVNSHHRAAEDAGSSAPST